MKIKIMDTTDFKFEKEKYNTIILDPPYIIESNKDKMKDKTRVNRFANQFCWFPDYKVARIVDRCFQYAYKNKIWLIVFNNRPLFLSRYLIVWVKKSAGLGYVIGRNVEYIHLVNYHGLTPKMCNKDHRIIDEGLIITQPWGRPALKPTELYKRLFLALESKRIFDPFAGWGNSVIAAKDLGLEIDALDIDESLQDRYKFLRKYKPSRIDSFIDFSGVESET